MLTKTHEEQERVLKVVKADGITEETFDLRPASEYKTWYLTNKIYKNTFCITSRYSQGIAETAEFEVLHNWSTYAAPSHQLPTLSVANCHAEPRIIDMLP